MDNCPKSDLISFEVRSVPIRNGNTDEELKEKGLWKYVRSVPIRNGNSVPTCESEPIYASVRSVPIRNGNPDSRVSYSRWKSTFVACL